MTAVRNIVILTGAGISAESGLGTFRGPEGPWEGHRVEDVCTPEAFARDPALVHARGGDGKTPLHYATSVAMARYLVERGAVVDARDVDHESTPAQ